MLSNASSFRSPERVEAMMFFLHALAARLRRSLTTIAAWACFAGPALAQAPVCPPSAQVPTPEAVAQARREHSRDRGYLWRISRDGRDSYLFGTIHIGRFEWMFQGPQVIGALRAADVLALEIDPTDATIQQRMASQMNQPPAPGLVDDALRARLQRGFEAACLPLAALAAMHPVMQAMTLTVLEGRRDGLDPSYAQEGVLAGAARTLGKRIVSLETPELQIKTLLGSDTARSRMLVEDTLAQLEDGRTRRMLKRMGEIWATSDLAGLEAYESWCECAVTENDRRFLRELNDGRNPAMADRIEALHREGQRVFAGVGALHMTGEQALPGLMAKRGFAVERIRFGP